mmetsp:Transcript_39377/g.103087  ORF Transcript_39377/g.103087 Transcript_39377/m.103087 type:complete len:288 (-) Transcript_39377:483-1346(-)
MLTEAHFIAAPGGKRQRPEREQRVSAHGNGLQRCPGERCRTLWKGMKADPGRVTATLPVRGDHSDAIVGNTEPLARHIQIPFVQLKSSSNIHTSRHHHPPHLLCSSVRPQAGRVPPRHHISHQLHPESQGVLRSRIQIVPPIVLQRPHGSILHVPRAVHRRAGAAGRQKELGSPVVRGEHVPLHVDAAGVASAAAPHLHCVRPDLRQTVLRRQPNHQHPGLPARSSPAPLRAARTHQKPPGRRRRVRDLHWDGHHGPHPRGGPGPGGPGGNEGGHGGAGAGELEVLC